MLKNELCYFHQSNCAIMHLMLILAASLSRIAVSHINVLCAPAIQSTYPGTFKYLCNTGILTP